MNCGSLARGPAVAARQVFASKKRSLAGTGNERRHLAPSIVFTQVGLANAPVRDGHRTGWTSALDLLAAILEEKS